MPSAKVDLDRVRAAELEAVILLIRGICHEMNNPLTGILGYSQLLLASTGGNEDVQDDLRHVESCARRLHVLVERLTRLAHREAAAPGDFHINPVLRQIPEELEYHLNRYFITLHLDLTEDLPPIAGDPHEIRLSIVLLLIRSIVAMKESGGRLRIHTGQDGDRVSIEVEDSVAQPIAIDQDETHYQTAVHLLESHDGHFKGVAEPGKGYRWTVSLPVWSGDDMGRYLLP